MAKIQSKKRTGNGGDGPLCPYCRSAVKDGPIVVCDQCETQYHKECVRACVILGCSGRLLAKPEGTANSKISVTAKQKAPGVKGADSCDDSSSELIANTLLFLGLALLFFGILFGCSSESKWLFLVCIAGMGSLIFYLALATGVEDSGKELASKARAEKDAEERRREPPDPEEESPTENPGRDNFYAQPNIAAPSSDPLQPDSSG